MSIHRAAARRLALLGSGLVLAAIALAARAAFADPLPLFYQGVRPLGMGGAFTAVANDENAMFYNPAGLNSIKSGRVEIINPLIEASTNTSEFVQDVQEVADADTDAEQADLAAALLDKWLGERVHARAAVFPNVTFHNFGLGVLGQATVDGEVHNPAGSNTLQLRGGYDLAALVSGALGFSPAGATLRVGLTGKFVRRELLDQSYTTNDLVQQDGIDLDEDLIDGRGFGADVGVILGFPIALKPAIGVTVQNVGDLDLGDAGSLPQQINVGLALQPTLPFGDLTLALDLIDATTEIGTDSDLAKRLHAGAELKLPKVLSLRTGLNQGYFSAGATVDLRILKIAYAYSIEEIGAFAGQTPERRHIAQLSLGF